MSRAFQRKIEDFVCEHCGAIVSGDGYTNHCPKCLWSKHVDVNPGDRLENCGGLMEPVTIVLRNKIYVITHRCAKCGFKKNNKAVRVDNLDIMIGI